MRNQRSFRTKSRLKVVDNAVKVSQVIGKKNSSGNPFYPSFTDETVVLVSEDKRIYETTKASADGLGNLTFSLRGLADDGTDTEVAKFKKAWMPGTLMFVTIGGQTIDSKADKSDLDDYTPTASLAAVALSNDYNDLDNKLTAGANITIDGNNEISATDTTYSATDFDIKDLADTTDLRAEWSGKQDALESGSNIKTINNNSLLGSGNINISGGGGLVEVTVNTAHGTSAKTGSTSGGTYSPSTGDLLLVNFVYGNTADNVTLNIDNSGVKNIKIGGANADRNSLDLVSSNTATNSRVLMTYDGTNYVTHATANTTGGTVMAETSYDPSDYENNFLYFTY